MQIHCLIWCDLCFLLGWRWKSGVADQICLCFPNGVLKLLMVCEFHWAFVCLWFLVLYNVLDLVIKGRFWWTYHEVECYFVISIGSVWLLRKWYEIGTVVFDIKRSTWNWELLEIYSGLIISLNQGRGAFNFSATKWFGQSICRMEIVCSSFLMILPSKSLIFHLDLFAFSFNFVYTI